MVFYVRLIGSLSRRGALTAAATAQPSFFPLDRGREHWKVPIAEKVEEMEE